MLSRRTMMIAWIALAAMSSTAFGIVIDIEIHSKQGLDQSKDFQVQTATRDGSVHFKVRHSVREGRHYSGKLVIRKGDCQVASCPMLPSEDASSVLFTFSVSTDYLAESDFFLSVDRWDELSVIDSTGKTIQTKKEMVGDVRLHLPLRLFVEQENESK